MRLRVSSCFLLGFVMAAASAFPSWAADRCAGIASIDAAQLARSIHQIEVTLQAAQTAADTAGPTESEVILQRKLLGEMEQQQCLAEAQENRKKGLFSGGNALKIPVFYVTDRVHASSDAGALFGATRNEKGLAYGRVETSIAEIGAMRTSFIPGTKRMNAKSIRASGQIGNNEPLTQEALFRSVSELRSKLPPNAPLRVLLFVHGYNVTFDEAAIAAAKLASSMQVPLVPVFFSWPSQGHATGYWHDEDTIPGSTLQFISFFTNLLSGPEDEIVVVCHSMGSRIVTRTFGELSRRGVSTEKLKKVAFAAADIGVDEFSQEWPSLEKLSQAQWTLYASSGDYALRLSKVVHAYKRIGESDQGFSFFSGMDTIDASNTTTFFKTLGHSYVTGSPVVGADIGDWVSQDLPPSSRGLEREIQSRDVYWRFP